MQRRVALIALLGGIAAIVAIVALSGGGSDGKPSEAGSETAAERPDTRSGPSGERSDEAASAPGRSGRAERRSRRRAGQGTRRRRGPRRQEQGRLGPQTGGAPAQGERLERRRPGETVATIDLVGGAPVGGVQRVSFQKDDRVRLIVRADTDEVVEIPGYGLRRRVRAGDSARFYFETSKEGLFEIELQRGQTRIGVLAVG